METPLYDKWLKGKWKSLLIDVLNSTLGAIKRAKGAVLVRKMTDPQGIHRMPAKHRDCTGGEKKKQWFNQEKLRFKRVKQYT